MPRKNNRAVVKKRRRYTTRLNDARHHTSSKILGRIDKSPGLHLRSQNLSNQVQKALKYGVESGLLKQKGGRYILQEDKISSPTKPKYTTSGPINIRDNNKNKANKYARKVKGKRKRSPSTSSVTESTSSASEYSYTTATSYTNKSKSRSVGNKAVHSKSKKSRSKTAKAKTTSKAKERRKRESDDPRSPSPQPIAPEPEAQPKPSNEPKQEDVEVIRRPSAVSSRVRFRRQKLCDNDELPDIERRPNEDRSRTYRQKPKDDNSQSDGPADDYIN